MFKQLIYLVFSIQIKVGRSTTWSSYRHLKVKFPNIEKPSSTEYGKR